MKLSFLLTSQHGDIASHYLVGTALFAQSPPEDFTGYLLTAIGGLVTVIITLAAYIRQMHKEHRKEIREMQEVYTAALDEVTKTMVTVADELKLLNSGISIEKRFEDLEKNLLASKVKGS